MLSRCTKHATDDITSSDEITELVSPGLMIPWDSLPRCDCRLPLGGENYVFHWQAPLGHDATGAMSPIMSTHQVLAAGEVAPFPPQIRDRVHISSRHLEIRRPALDEAHRGIEILNLATPRSKPGTGRHRPVDERRPATRRHPAPQPPYPHHSVTGHRLREVAILPPCRQRTVQMTLPRPVTCHLRPDLPVPRPSPIIGLLPQSPQQPATAASPGRHRSCRRGYPVGENQ